MKAVNIVKTAVWIAFLAGISAAGVKNVAVVETEIDDQSGAAAKITKAEVRLVTAELRREAVNNLPRDKYNIMTTETVYAQGSATLEACAEENCVITLGAKIGADYIVRGIISRLQTMLTLTVEIYETEDGNLVASSAPVRSEKVGELIDKAAAACAEMYRTFASEQNPIPQRSMPQPKVQPLTYTTRTYSLTTHVYPQGRGWVTLNPDKKTYAEDEEVSVVATPAYGYTFVGWSGAAFGGINHVMVKMDMDKTVTAHFSKKLEAGSKPEATVQTPKANSLQTYTLVTNVSPKGSGVVTRNPDKETYAAGEEVSVSATPLYGYTLTGWTLNSWTGTGWTSAELNVKNPMPIKMGTYKTLTANFQRDMHGNNALTAKVQRDIDYVHRKTISTKKNSLGVDLLTPAVCALPVWTNDEGETGKGNAFGFMLQYARRLGDTFGLVGRYSYFGVWDFETTDTHYIKDWASHMHTFEMRPRFYPTGENFFGDAMLGYYVNTISGYYGDRNYHDNYCYISGTYDYFMGGVSLGWHAGGCEFSFGWNFALSNGKRMVAYDPYGSWLGGTGPRLVFALGGSF